MSDQPADPSAGPSGLTLAAIVVESYRLIIAAGFAVALILFGVAVITPARYSSTILLVPSTPSGGVSQLGGLASQLGLGDAVGGGVNPTASAVFLTKLATSDVILSRMLDDTLSKDDEPGARTSLLELASSDPVVSFGRRESEPRRRVRAVREIKRWVSAASDRETGSARISVRTKWPNVSLHIANRVAMELDRLNIELSTARATAERRFLEERLQDQQQSLRTAEGQFQRFLENNRQFGSSAALTFQRDRLQRDVALQQQLLTSLAQSLEDARLREVQNTPVVTIVEPARYPFLADPRKAFQRGVLGFLAGSTMVGVALVFLRLLEHRAAQGDSDSSRLLAGIDRLRAIGRRGTSAARAHQPS